jgi:hypothetical protein
MISYMASCRGPPSLVRDRIPKQQLRLGEVIVALAKIHHASGCLEIEDHSGTNHFWRDGGAIRRDPCAAGSVGGVAHAAMTPAQTVAREQFSSECRICAKRTLVGSNTERLAKTWSKLHHTLEMLFPDLLCKLPTSMTVSTQV